MKRFKTILSEANLIKASNSEIRKGEIPYKPSKRKEDFGEFGRRESTKSREIPKIKSTDDKDPTQRLTPTGEIKKEIGYGFQVKKSNSKDLTDLDLIKLYRSSNKNKLNKMILKRGGNPQQVSGFINALKLKRKTSKQQISEKIDFGDPTLPPGFDPGSPIRGGFELGVSSGAIAGIDPTTFPSINYRSAAMTPGAPQDDGFISGGQGWKIDKGSKEFFSKMAKMYGVNSYDVTNKLKEIQQSEQKNKSYANAERLVFNYITDPLMSELIQSNKQKELIKAATEMQSWKADFQNPLKRLSSSYPQSYDIVFNKKQREEGYKNSQNLSKIGNILKQKVMSTDIYSDLHKLKIAPVNNPYIKDNTNPIEIKLSILDKMLLDYEQEDLEKEEALDTSSSSSSSNDSTISSNTD